MVDGSPVVVLTRSAIDNAALADRLMAAGATVVELPTVTMAFVPPLQSADELTALLQLTPAIAFTSRFGVHGWLAWHGADGLRMALERGAAVAVVGEATAQALRAAGLSPTLVAEPATGSALAALLLAALPQEGGAPVLTVGGRHTRPELADGLRAGGRELTAAVVYHNRPPEPPDLALLQRADAAAAIYVAAPSAADRLLDWRPTLRDRPFVAIGPTTAAALTERHGIVAAAVAETPGVTAVEAAILRTIQFGSSQ